MRQFYFDIAFALSGDKTAIPDPLQVSGAVSMTEGWNFNYQRDLSTDPAARPIDRATMNWLFAQITTGLQALQQTGAPEWITAAQNGGTSLPYGKGSVVLYSASGNPPFVKYVSLIDSNTDTPGATANWQVVADAIASSAQAAAGTDNATIMTPLRVATQDALRALLAGNSSQVFNVANASASTHAVALGQIVGLTAGRLLNVRRFTANGTYTPTPGTTAIIVDVVGGGGAGGSVGATAAGQLGVGGGGGAGGHARSYLTTGFSGVSMTIGAGGVGGAPSTGGGTTSFGALLQATGGGAGSGANGTPPPYVTINGYGGVGSGGNVSNGKGGDGLPGLGIASGSFIAGAGGMSFVGMGASGQPTTTAPGVAATIAGAGGSAALNGASSAGQTGGNGAAGEIVVYEFGAV